MGDDEYSGPKPAMRLGDPLDDEAFDPELWALLSAIVETCCDLLDQPDADLFCRAHLGAQTPAQIAKNTGLSEVDVETQLVDAQRKLFDLMVLSLSPHAP